VDGWSERGDASLASQKQDGCNPFRCIANRVSPSAHSERSSQAAGDESARPSAARAQRRRAAFVCMTEIVQPHPVEFREFANSVQRLARFTRDSDGSRPGMTRPIVERHNIQHDIAALLSGIRLAPVFESANLRQRARCRRPPPSRRISKRDNGQEKQSDRGDCLRIARPPSSAPFSTLPSEPAHHRSESLSRRSGNRSTCRMDSFLHPKPHRSPD